MQRGNYLILSEIIILFCIMHNKYMYIYNVSKIDYFKIRLMRVSQNIK